MYEVAADVFGRDIRYGSLPASDDARETVEFLLSLSSDHIAPLEDLTNQIGQDVATLEYNLHDINQVPKENRSELLRKYRSAQASFDRTQEQVRSLNARVKESLLDLTDMFTKVREEKHG